MEELSPTSAKSPQGDTIFQMPTGKNLQDMSTEEKMVISEFKDIADMNLFISQHLNAITKIKAFADNLRGK
ncbi:MAG: hypothetical protein ACLQPD_12075 [Desulfomonilaceae bacterium]